MDGNWLALITSRLLSIETSDHTHQDLCSTYLSSSCCTANLNTVGWFERKKSLKNLKKPPKTSKNNSKNYQIVLDFSTVIQAHCAWPRKWLLLEMGTISNNWLERQSKDPRSNLLNVFLLSPRLQIIAAFHQDRITNNSSYVEEEEGSFV
jgi:hypothetical protein